MITPDQQGPDSLVVLTAQGSRLLAKTFTQTDKPQPVEKAYDLAKRFTGSIERTRNIHELAELLAGLSADPKAAVIIGDFRQDADLRRYVNRMKNPDPKKQHVVPDIVDSPTGKHMLPLDVENIPMPQTSAVLVEGGKVVGILDPVAAVRSVIETYLPPYLHDATAAYAFTSSAGVKGWDEVRLRLWYYMSEPVPAAQLKTWASRIRGLDTSIYTSNHLIYTAAPVFVNMPDPCEGWRSGVINAA